MISYTKYPRGSEWRIWDLHIHTPETKKNDRFIGPNPETRWENYIQSINESAAEIACIGITDYFSIENYFKFKAFVASGKILKKFEMIIPNIELRILPTTSTSTAINIHCIFNPNIDHEIENRFLAKLSFQHSGTNYSAAPLELARLGRVLKDDPNMESSIATKFGIEQYVISYDHLRTIFEKDQNLRDNTIIVVSNKGNDGVSGIVKHEDFFTGNVSQLDATRQSIYQFSDAIFSSNENDRNYFIGKGADKKEIVIKKCGTLMPCFHGCDAHSNDKIFNPEQNRFCWIKADPTFEGLKQTLYEPEDRIRIQTLKPDIKNERYVISELKFLDEHNLFGNRSIYLNENLNSIIGGKSSGKSLLLYNTAECIDPDQVGRASKRLNFEGYKFEQSYDFEVVWKNGEIDRLNDRLLTNKNHGITYIPQLYINYLVERNNKEELNALIRNILVQDVIYKAFFEATNDRIKRATTDIERTINIYFQIRNKALEIQTKIKETGASATILNGINQIQKNIEDGQKTSNLNTLEFSAYTSLAKQKAEKEKQLALVEQQESIINKIEAELLANMVNLLGKQEEETTFMKGQIDRLLDEVTEIPVGLKKIKQRLMVDYKTLIKNFKEEVEKINTAKQKSDLILEIAALNISLGPYLGKIAGQEELKKLTLQLQAETKKKEFSENLEKQLKELSKDYESTRAQLVRFLSERFEEYKSLVSTINSTKSEIGSEIKLSAELIYKDQQQPLFDFANKSAISRDHFFNSLFKNGFLDYGELLKITALPIRVVDDKLIISSEIQIPLKLNIDFESILRGLIKDEFEIDYTVTYKLDNLLTMSPGKKGTVLLILFLQISSAEYPILIDQPEDNLDNRTIYDLLCQMIKNKKKERQIIIVSHNANLVVATDSENIIIANQAGQSNTVETNQMRFEYVNGSLEHSFTNNGTNILHRQGVKEHVTDILEGGGEAFKQRERKYAIK
ncbi:hypothetical protein DHW03_15490 [Pedobacter yonginense]|uniref:DNA repair protein n=1 Tax=Pedobacter yonginense TaxID=651869 RepID=A0A317ELN6_9SPHI|nr:hypothetical protein [Pedobacter yonginense]PWS26196.1 hypothetical protein DHW03_15490 [Pedobacter yonginense]